MIEYLQSKRVSGASEAASLSQSAYVEKGIEKMNVTTNKQNDSKQSPDNDTEIHEDCGTPDCCGECETAEITEEESVTAYGHIKRRIDDR